MKTDYEFLERPLPTALDAFEGKEKGKKAMIILGGSSGKYWRNLIQRVDNPMEWIFIGVNAVKTQIPDLDYWICHENMSRHVIQAAKGDLDSQAHVDAWRMPLNPKYEREPNPIYTPGYSFVNYKSYKYLPVKTNVVQICSFGPQWGWDPRKFGNGLLCGPDLVRKETHHGSVAIGTGASRAIHLAAILGVDEIHTIGLDLCFKDEHHHHWYNFPLYRPEKNTWTDQAFLTYYGLRTTWMWLETAEFLLGYVKKNLVDVGVSWHDHSDGLLQKFSGMPDERFMYPAPNPKGL